MTNAEKKLLFLNRVAFYSLLVCVPKNNEFGYIDPFRIRFLKIRKYIYNLYFKYLCDSIRIKEK